MAPSSRSPPPRGPSYSGRDGNRDRDRDRDRRRDDRDRRRRDSPPPRSSRDDRYPDKPRPRDDYSSRKDDRRDRDRRDDRSYGDGRRDRRDDNHRRRSRSPKRDSRSASAAASPKPAAKPNFGNSGLLAAATNTVKASDGTSTVLKYNEPPEARKPTQNWRLYVFKGKEDLGLLHIAKQSCYLVGRDHLVADIPIDHPSCSKQHAALQYRQVHEKDEWGASKAVVKPFLIDLESTNGTFVNDKPIPVSRYYELKQSDVIKFGQSTREYVLLNEDDA